MGDRRWSNTSPTPSRASGKVKSYEAKADEAHSLPDGTVLALGHSHGEGSGRSFVLHWMALYAPEGSELKVKMISLGSETPAGSQVQAPSSR